MNRREMFALVGLASFADPAISMARTNALVEKVAQQWAPPRHQSVSEWADENFRLSPEYAAEHGAWKTLSFQREPLDEFTNPRIWQIVIKSCTQLLKTTVIQITAAYAIDRDPGPMLIIQPRDADAKSFSKERVGPMLRDVPCLTEKVAISRAKKSDNTIEEKWFKGGLLAITSAGSPGNLARRAIRYLYCDEEDKYPESAGAEGKPFSLALKRTATFRHRRRAIRCCSPTVAGSSIDLAYEQSDQREFYVPCWSCGHFQTMMGKFRTQVRWDSSLPTREEQARSARYHCEACDMAWNDAGRGLAIENGHWRAHAPANGVAGFWISELYSPWKRLEEIVLDYLIKKDNPVDLQTFVNTSLAENWEEPGEKLEWDRLLERREPYQVGVVPAKGLFLTAGADVQRADGGRIEVEIVAWGENRESWSVDYRVFYGNPALPETWQPIEAMLRGSIPHESGGEMVIERFFVDSGDGTTTRDVYEWVQKQPRPRVWAIKGDRRSEQPVSAPRSVEAHANGRKTAYGAILRNIDVSYFKGAFYADLKKRRPTMEELAAGSTHPQGYCHFPIGEAYGDEHFKQVCAEQLVTRKNKQGRMVTEYEAIRPRNEALDCRIYAMAAAWDYGLHHLQPRHWQTLREQLERSARAKRQPEPQPQPATQPTFRRVAGRFSI